MYTIQDGVMQAGDIPVGTDTDGDGDTEAGIVLGDIIVIGEALIGDGI